MLETYLRRAVMAGLYLLPLTLIIYWQKTIYPFVTLKIYVFQALVAFIVALWFILALLYPRYRPKVTLLSASLFALISILVLTAALGVNPHRSFWSTPDRGIGVIGIIHFFGLFLVLKSLGKGFNWRKYLSWIFSISIVSAIFAVVQQIRPGFFYALNDVRPGSFFGNPAFFASFLLFTVFLGGWLAKTALHKKARWYFIIGSVFEALIVINTNTRGAILGLVIGGIVLLFLTKRRRLMIFGLSGLIGLALIIGLTSSAAVWQKIPGINRLTQISLNDSAVSNRLTVWRIALTSWTTRPVLGFGFENFRSQMDPHYDPELLKAGFGETFFDKPHNIVLELLGSGGIVALALYVLVLIAAVRTLVTRAPPEFKIYALAGLTAYVIQNFFIFDTFGSYFMFFVFLALTDLYSSEISLPQLKVIKSTVALKVVASVIVVLGCLYLIWLNARIVYANNRQYHGTNFLVSSFTPQGIAAFHRALSISQPYQNDMRINYVQLLSQMAPRIDIPNEENEIDFALAEAQKALAYDPNNYSWWLVLADGRTFFAATHERFLVGANEEIARAIALSPRRQQSYYVTAKLAWIQQGVGAGFKEMQKAVDLDPTAGDPHFYYALLAYQTGDTKKTIEELDKARALGRKPVTIEELRLVGAYYADAERYDIAVEYLKAAYEIDRSDVETEIKLAIVYVYKGEPTLAKPLFENVLRRAPEVRQSPNWPALMSLLDQAGVTY